MKSFQAAIFLGVASQAISLHQPRVNELDYIPPNEAGAKYEQWLNEFCDISYADAPAATREKYPEDSGAYRKVSAEKGYPKRGWTPSEQQRAIGRDIEYQRM